MRLLLSAIRTTLLYLAVTVIMRLMGKRQVGELQPYELVIAVFIAELAAIPVADTDIPLFNGLIPIVVLLVLQVLLSEFTMWSEKARKLVCGTPSILIEHGVILEKELQRLRINLNDLFEQLRKKNFPNVADVDYAILETNGQLSVIAKSGRSPVTGSDLGLKPPATGLPITLVLDGKLNQHNLRLSGLSLEVLKQHAQARGIASIQDVFFANVDETGSIHLQAKEGSA